MRTAQVKHLAYIIKILFMKFHHAIIFAPAINPAFTISSAGIVSYDTLPTSTVRHSSSPHTSQHWLCPVLASIKSSKSKSTGGIKKLKESQADFAIVNDVSRKDRGFESDNNEVYIISKNGAVKKIPLTSKREIAEKIVEFVF